MVNLGDKVRIDISELDRKRFTATAYDRFQGSTGVVINSYPDRSKFLVKFDEPKEKLYENGLSVESFWFYESNCIKY